LSKNKNLLDLPTNTFLQSTCRQCHASIPSASNFCSLCGIARPNAQKLNPLEKEYLKHNPMIPAKYEKMCSTIQPRLSLAANIKEEIVNYLSNPATSYFFIIALTTFIFGSAFLLTHIAFPLSFMMFWAGLVYLLYDAINFTRAVTVGYLVKRLQYKKGLSPYSAYFKIEGKIEKMLESLGVVVCSLFERDLTNSGEELKSSSENFISAANVLTDQINRYASVSIETATIIWRNNVYAIVASKSSFQDKIISIGNKIREAEAMILRYKWLLSLADITKEMNNYIANEIPEKFSSSRNYGHSVLSEFRLSQFGPISENYAGNFSTLPFELPFKARYYWHQQLPPLPLQSMEFVKELPLAVELFESIQQVRKLKIKLEEQMVLNCASNAMSNVSILDNGASSSNDAAELLKYQLYSKYLDIPKFQPDSQEMKNQTDKLTAEDVK